MRTSLAEEIARAPWVKSSYSTNPNGCLQIKRLSTCVVIGDTKTPNGPTLTVSNENWDAFVLSTLDGSASVAGALSATAEPDGGFTLRLSATASPVLRYTHSERVAFLRGISNGELHSSDFHELTTTGP